MCSSGKCLVFFFDFSSNYCDVLWRCMGGVVNNFRKGSLRHLGISSCFNDLRCFGGNHLARDLTPLTLNTLALLSLQCCISSSSSRTASFRADSLNSSYLLDMSTSLLWLAVIALSHLTPAHADSNGMDMSMDGAMDLASGAMKPYLHFTLGDILWFQGWVPQNAGAMVGACIGLFLLAIVERWIGACRSLMEAHWRKKCVD